MSSLADTTTETTSLSLDNPLLALLSINSQFQGTENQEALKRSINFMTYELQALSQGQPASLALEQLNHFFFNTKGFRVSRQYFLLHDILTHRTGCSIALALLYQQLAEALGLRCQLLNVPQHALIKIESESGTLFFDLERGGHILSEDEVLTLINKNKEPLKPLSLPESVAQYLSYLAFEFRHSDEQTQLHQALSLILLLEPENTRFLAERALLRKKMGLLKDALCDLKRYFSFTERSCAPTEISLAYEELRT